MSEESSSLFGKTYKHLLKTYKLTRDTVMFVYLFYSATIYRLHEIHF